MKIKSLQFILGLIIPFASLSTLYSQDEFKKLLEKFEERFQEFMNESDRKFSEFLVY